jgi:RNA polymerase sigma-70 factor (ECF subfamily)
LNDLNPSDLLTDHCDYLYRYALVRLRDEYLAEDAVQETLLAALSAQDGKGFAAKSAVRTWLTGILKHKIIDHFRRSQREQPLPDNGAADEPMEPGMDEFFLDDGHWAEPPSSLGNPAALLEQHQFWQVMQDCLERLPKALARIFLLREIEEKENAEICKELEISPTNAWVMLYRARMGLRKCLEINWLEGNDA